MRASGTGVAVNAQNRANLVILKFSREDVGRAVAQPFDDQNNWPKVPLADRIGAVDVRVRHVTSKNTCSTDAWRSLELIPERLLTAARQTFSLSLRWSLCRRTPNNRMFCELLLTGTSTERAPGAQPPQRWRSEAA